MKLKKSVSKGLSRGYRVSFLPKLVSINCHNYKQLRQTGNLTSVQTRYFFFENCRL